MSPITRCDESPICGTQGHIKNHLGPALGKYKAQDVSSAAIKRYIDRRQSEKAADATINRELSTLRKAYQLAYDAKPRLVPEVLKFKKLSEADNVREGFFEHEQYLKMRELPFHQQLILVIGYHLGLRRAEILSLRWDQVDWQANLLRLSPKTTKTKKSRNAPLYGELRSFLEVAPRDCPYLVSYEGRRISEIKRAWNTARKAAGLPKLLVHDLRRTAIRNMVRAGIPEKTAMLISGHKTRSVFDRYNIIGERDIIAAGKSMETYLAAQSTVPNCPYSVPTLTNSSQFHSAR